MIRLACLKWLRLPTLLVLLLFACRKEKKDDPEVVRQSNNTLSAGPEKSVALASDMSEGKTLYTTHCLVCHQVTGGGVNGLNPPLKKTEYVLGDKGRLVAILLDGSNEGLSINGVSYSNAMPGFASLSDLQLAQLATYIRNSFGNTAGSVTAEEVAAVRAAK